MRFEFATAGRIVFGAGTAQETGPAAAGLGSRALVVTGTSAARVAPTLESLNASGIACDSFAVTGEPTTDTVERGVQQARGFDCDLVVAIGGGSVLDTGKAIAALVSNGGALLDYLEVIGHARPLSKPSLPFIAVPTTAGTGAEATRNAVLGSPEHGVKVSLRSPFMLPKVAIVDPLLAHSMPPYVTAATGLDALTQLIEPFVSCRANPLTDALCRDGMARAARSLRRAYDNGDDAGAREDMALASLYGGMALANAGLGAVHGLAGPIGGMFPAPHGALCGCLLPHVMARNLTALRERQRESRSLGRYGELARLLTREANATADAGLEWLSSLVSSLSLPRLRQYGVTRADMPQIVVRAQAASSMRANPLPLTDAELADILEAAL